MHGEADFRRTPEPLPPYVPRSPRPAVGSAGGLLPPWTSAHRSIAYPRPPVAPATEPFELVEPATGDEPVAPDPQAAESSPPAWLDAAAAPPEAEPWDDGSVEDVASRQAFAEPVEATDETHTDSREEFPPPREDWSELFEVETYLSAEAAADLEAYLSEGASQAEVTGTGEQTEPAVGAEEALPAGEGFASALVEPVADEDEAAADTVWEPDFGEVAEEPAGVLLTVDEAEEEAAEAAGPGTDSAPLDTWPGEAEAWDTVAASGTAPEPAQAASQLDVLARRLEEFAARLRHDGETALDRAFSGDRLDAALAALISGHRAASGE